MKYNDQFFGRVGRLYNITDGRLWEIIYLQTCRPLTYYVIHNIFISYSNITINNCHVDYLILLYAFQIKIIYYISKMSIVKS